MSRFLILAVLLLPLTVTAQQQSDSTANPGKWELTIGAGFGTTWRNKTFLDANGLVVSAEPAYKISSLISIGARLEYAFIKTFYTGESASEGEVNAKSFPSVLITGNIKPWRGAVSPYLGLGAGFYFLGTATKAGSGATETDLQTRFGLAPRIGLQIKNFGLLAEVNIIDEQTLYNRDYASLKVTYKF